MVRLALLFVGAGNHKGGGVGHNLGLRRDPRRPDLHSVQAQAAQGGQQRQPDQYWQ